MHKRWMVLLGFALCAGTAQAAPEHYTIDPGHTFPHWTVSHHGFSLHRGRFNQTAGTLAVDWQAKTGRLDLQIETASVSTGDPALEKVLRSPNFFDTERFPRITFRGTDLRFEKDVPVAITGDLTLLAVTRPVTFRLSAVRCGVHPLSKRALCGAEAEGAIRRSDFGMSYGLPSVGDEIRLMVQFEAFRD